MALNVNKKTDNLLIALSYLYNAAQSVLCTDGYHTDRTQSTTGNFLDRSNIVLTNLAITSPNATDLPTTITLTNELVGKMSVHFLDKQSHNQVADTTNNPSADGYSNTATDLPSCEIILNALQLLYGAHILRSDSHRSADTTPSHTVSGTPSATSLGTAETLANALKAAFNLHTASAPTVAMNRLNLIPA